MMTDPMPILQGCQIAVTFIMAIAFVFVTRLNRTPLTISLFASVFCAFMVNIGYSLVLLSNDVREAMNAIRIEYIGSAYIAFTFMLFMFRYVRIRFSGFLKLLLFIWHSVVFVLIFTWDMNDLYYDGVEFENGFLRHGNGPLYYVEMIAILLEIFTSLFLIIREVIIRRKKKGSKNYLLIAFGMSVPVAGYLAFNFNLFWGFDTVPASEAISAIIFMIAIKRAGILNGRNVAHERIIKTFEEGIVITDRELNVIEINDKAEQLFPDLSQSIGKKASDEVVLSVFLDGGREEMVIDKRVYRAQVQDFTANGTVQGHAALFVDMTSEHERLDTAKRLKDEADGAARNKAEFLAGMSHEIRTPINAVLGMNEMVMRETRDNLVKAYAIDLRSAASSLLSIVNNILDMSKIEEGKMVLLLGQYDIRALAEDVKNIVSQGAVEKGVLFVTRISEEIPGSLFGDELRLRQSLANLLSSAIDATREGAVTLTIEETERNEEEAVLSLHFRIGYTGELLSGNDLKVSLSMAFIDLMGGAVRFSNEEGISIITFEIKQGIAPALQKMRGKSKASEGTRDVKKEGSLIFAPGARLLVCDDDRLNLKVFTSLLSGTGMEVDAVGSGEELLTRVREKTYHIIFLDHMMPKMDGVETLHRMRELQGNLNTSVPVVVLTANAVAGAENDYIREGFDDYLSKPIDMKALSGLLERYLPKDIVKEREKNEAEEPSQEGAVALPLIEGFDLSESKKLLIKDGLVLDTLLDFYDNIDSRVAALKEEEEKIREGSELSDFRITAHSIKSNLRMLGNSSLASLSEEGESCAASGDREGALSKLTKLCDELLQAKKNIAGAMKESLKARSTKDEGVSERIEGNELIRLLSTLLEALRDRDYDRMDSTAASMKDYEYPDEIREDVPKVLSDIDNLDIMSAVERTEKLLKMAKAGKEGD